MKQPTLSMAKSFRSGSGLLKLAVLMLLFLAASALCAESPTPPKARVLIEYQGDWSRQFSDSFAAALMQSPDVEAAIQLKEADSDPEMTAARKNCSIIVQLDRREASGWTLLSWTVSLPWQSDIKKAMLRQSSPSLSLAGTQLWPQVIADIESVDSAIGSYPSLLTLQGSPGTTVSGCGADVVIPDSGSIDVPLAIPSYISWLAQAGGARDESGVLLVRQSGQVLKIPRHEVEALPSWTLDASALGFSFPELGLRKELDSGWFFRLMLSQYLFGLDLSTSTSSTESIVSSYNLLQPSLGLGCIPLGRSASFRPYASLDVFARLRTEDSAAPKLDSVAPMGLTAALGFDWGMDSRLRVFGELGFVFYPWTSPILMEASYGQGGEGRLGFGSSGFLPGQPGWFAEFPVPRIGLRLGL